MRLSKRSLVVITLVLSAFVLLFPVGFESRCAGHGDSAACNEVGVSLVGVEVPGAALVGGVVLLLGALGSIGLALDRRSGRRDPRTKTG